MVGVRKIFAGVTLLICGFSFVGNAQEEGGGEKAYKSDFTYEKRTIEERKVIPYPPLRQADVMYARRIHRILDMREKQNLAMLWPKNPFNCTVYNAVMKGIQGKKLTPYKNDSLTSYYTREKVIDRISSENPSEYTPYPIERPSYVRDTVYNDKLDCSEINKFRIMEDWIFDKEASEFFPRIIAIAPLFQPERGGAKLGETQMFWVKWKELRKVLVNEPMFNRHNDEARLSYYDFFEQRLFSSYIVKEPNEFDVDIENIPKYRGDKFAQLMKAQKVKKELFNFEHDLWQY